MQSLQQHTLRKFPMNGGASPDVVANRTDVTASLAPVQDVRSRSCPFTAVYTIALPSDSAAATAPQSAACTSSTSALPELPPAAALHYTIACNSAFHRDTSSVSQNEYRPLQRPANSTTLAREYFLQVTTWIVSRSQAVGRLRYHMCTGVCTGV